MEDEKFAFRWQTTNGKQIIVDDLTITPEAQALTVRVPFGGLVWNRPTAVLVEQNGEQRRLPVIDVTRTAVFTLYSLAIGATLGTLLALLLARTNHGRDFPRHDE